MNAPLILVPAETQLIPQAGRQEEVVRLVEQEEGPPDLHLFLHGFSLACKSGNVEMASCLLDKGEPFVKVFPGIMPLSFCCACEKGHLRLMELLAMRGADVTRYSNPLEQRPLALASIFGWVDVVRYLLGHLPVIATIDHGRTALRWSTFHGHVQVLKVLLQAGADPTVVDHQHMTPMDTARNRGKKRCGRILKVVR